MLPIPGSPVFVELLKDPELGPKLRVQDDIDLKFLERYWINHFTKVDYETVVGYRSKINELMKDYQVFGGLDDDGDGRQLQDKVLSC